MMVLRIPWSLAIPWKKRSTI